MKITGTFFGFNKKKRSTLSGDFDGDGVKNRKDCQPMNWRRQHDPDPVLDEPVIINDYNLSGMTTKNWNFFVEGKKVSKKEAWKALDSGLRVIGKFKRS